MDIEDDSADANDSEPKTAPVAIAEGLAPGGAGPLGPGTGTGNPLDALGGILFLLWGFPELTQTFIHREFEHLAARGARLRLLAAHRIDRPALTPRTAALADDAMYLGGPAEVWVRGQAWAARHPRRFAQLLSWVRRQPHRSALHRVRMTAMAFAAAATVGRVRGSGCSYLHAHFASYPTEWAACLSRLTGLPYGFTAHATDIWRDRNALAEKIRGARLVLSCTEHNVRHLRELAPDAAERVHLVRHGLDLQAFGPPTPQPDLAVPHWLAVGRLVEKKGFVHLIDAVGQLEARGEPVQITVLGAGPQEAVLRRRIAERGVPHRVRLAGAVENDEVLGFLARCTGLVVPSVRAANGDIDGIPNVILEAAAMGRPVVASSLSGIPEAVIHESTGLLVPPGAPDALADALRVVGASHDWAATLGVRGRALIERDFDVAKNTRLHAELLALAQRAPGPVIDPAVVTASDAGPLPAHAA